MRSSELPLIDRLLIEGLADWLDPGWIVGEACDSGIRNDGDFLTMTTGVAAVMLMDELAEAGDVERTGGFVPWQAEPAVSIARIHTGLSRIPVAEWRPGDVTWLSSTAAGDERGRRASDLVGRSEDEDDGSDGPSDDGPDLVERLVVRARAEGGLLSATSIYAATSEAGPTLPTDRKCLAVGAVARLLLEGLARLSPVDQAGSRDRPADVVFAEIYAQWHDPGAMSRLRFVVSDDAAVHAAAARARATGR